MPTFADRETLASVRDKINDAIVRIDTLTSVPGPEGPPGPPGPPGSPQIFVGATPPVDTTLLWLDTST